MLNNNFVNIQDIEENNVLKTNVKAWSLNRLVASPNIENYTYDTSSRISKCYKLFVFKQCNKDVQFYVSNASGTTFNLKVYQLPAKMMS
jgi:hypothetical protein